MAYNPYTGAVPTYTTNPSSGGAPGSGGAYGSVPNYPSTVTNTNQTIGTNAYPQLAAILGSGYQGGLNTEMGNISSLLQGQIPGDVMNQIGQAGAERGISTGSPGSPNSNAAMMRALGLTSLGLQQTGMQDLTQAISQVPIQQNQTSYETTDMSAVRAAAAAAPDPYLAAQQALQNAQAGIAAGGAGVRSGSPSVGGSSGVAPLSPQAPAYNPGTGGVYPSQGSGNTGQSLNNGYMNPLDFNNLIGGINPSDMSPDDFYNLIGGGSFDLGMNPDDFYNTIGGGSFAQQPGYQDTSGGTMYMGDQAGYGGYDDSWLYGDLGYSDSGY